VAKLRCFIKDEFDAFIDYCILTHGFLGRHCGECGHKKQLTFSRQRRGSRPSCGAGWTSQTAAPLVDHITSQVLVRQWVLSPPIALRLLLAAQPELVTSVRQLVRRVFNCHLLKRAEVLRVEADRLAERAGQW
jgi:hypothetical protein